MHTPTKESIASDLFREWASLTKLGLLEARMAALAGSRYRELRDRTEGLIEALNDAGLPDSYIAELIEAEPDLRLYLLERANRPFFGTVSSNHTISEIIMLLGREKVARFVLAQGLRQVLEPQTMATRRLTERCWRQGRIGAEKSVRVALDVAQRRDGGVVDVRAFDFVYGRSLLAPLAAVLALYLGDAGETLLDEPELSCLSNHDLAALLAFSWGASAALANDLAQLNRPDKAEDHTIDLIVVGQALAQVEGMEMTLPPTEATLNRLGFDISEWPKLWPEA